MSMALWPKVRNRQPLVQREFRGINKQDAFSIMDSFATDMSNLTNQFPALTVRPGFSLIGAALAGKILGLGIWKDTELHALAADGKWYRWDGAAWSAALATGLSTTAYASFCNFKGNLAGINLIMANGTDFKAYDGAAVSALATAPAGGNYVEQFADRLWCAVGNDLHFTAYRMANDWTTVNGDDADSGYITAETPNGETVNAVKAGIGHMTVFKPNSIHELFGYAPSDYRFVPVTFDFGTINNRCVVTLNGIMYILHRTGLYKYAGGTLPNRQFSLPIQWYIDNMNTTAKSLCSLGTDGKKLYIALPMNSSTNPDTIIEYDPQFGIWSVWNGFTPLAFATLGADLYTGSYDGKVKKIGGTADNGAAISWYWTSKPFGAGSMNQLIRWTRIWLVVDLPAGSTLTVYVSKSAEGDADWVSAGTITASSGFQSKRICISPSTLADSNWLRFKLSGTGPATVYEVDRDESVMPIV